MNIMNVWCTTDDSAYVYMLVKSIQNYLKNSLRKYFVTYFVKSICQHSSGDGWEGREKYNPGHCKRVQRSEWAWPRSVPHHMYWQMWVRFLLTILMDYKKLKNIMKCKIIDYILWKSIPFYICSDTNTTKRKLLVNV